ELVHAHWILPQGLIACFGKIILGTPYIITVHGSDIFGLRKFSVLKKLAINNANMVTVNSKATYAGVRELSNRARVELVPMGIDTTLFHPKKLTPKKKKDLYVVAVGRLIVWKGYEFLIRAIPLMLAEKKNIKVLIVGNGPEKESLVSLAKKLGVLEHISFLGNVSQSKLSSIFADCDVFVAPAITNSLTGEREGQGLAVIEAMAQGLPVVVSKSGGIQYLVDDNVTGLLVQEKDYEAIAEKVLLVLNDEKLRSRLTSMAVRSVGEKYGWKTIGKKFDIIFTNVFHNDKEV
ncbi:MAG: glycosyltransferase, partial [bacterium]|nr:glycosyltransferase [bacterium]